MSRLKLNANFFAEGTSEKTKDDIIAIIERQEKIDNELRDCSIYELNRAVASNKEMLADKYLKRTERASMEFFVQRLERILAEKATELEILREAHLENVPSDHECAFGTPYSNGTFESRCTCSYEFLKDFYLGDNQ